MRAEARLSREFAFHLHACPFGQVTLIGILHPVQQSPMRSVRSATNLDR